MLILSACLALADAEGGAAGQATSGPSQPVRRMILDRPPVPIIKPAEPPPARLPEAGQEDDEVVIGRLGLLAPAQTGGWFVMTFPAADGEPAQTQLVLPGPWLEQMEKIIARSPDAAFRVSGEVLRYKGGRYLLLHAVTQEVAAAGGQEAAPASGPAATGPASDAPATPQDIRRLLGRNRPGPPVLLPPDEEAARPGPGAAAKAPLPQDSSVLAARMVRVLPEEVGQWLVARFESDNTLQEPPMRLLPCRHLEKAEQINAQAGRPVRLQVSGEVFRYKDRKYLLLRSVRQERWLGQF